MIFIASSLIITDRTEIISITEIKKITVPTIYAPKRELGNKDIRILDSRFHGNDIFRQIPCFHTASELGNEGKKYWHEYVTD